MEDRIAELKHDLAADDFCLREFFATEAAFRSILLLFNLLGEFQRAAASPTIANPVPCASWFSFAALCSVAPGTTWTCTCRPLGAASNSASRCWKAS
jgi:hypothetical protein